MRFVKNLILILILFFVNLLIINILPYPLDNLDIVSLLIIWTIILSHDNFDLYFLIFFIFLIELFAGLPFGINLLTFMATYYIIKWLMTNIITNRSVYIIVFATIATTVAYRLLFLACLGIFNFFLEAKTIINISSLINICWEVLFTTIISLFCYVFFFTVRKKINPAYIYK